MKKILLVSLLFASTARAENLLCMGDSITAGFGVPQSYCEMVHGSNAGGVNSAFASHALEILPELLVNIHPKVVTIMYGTNDCYIDPGASGPRRPLAEYIHDLTATIRYLQHRGIHVILMTPPAFGDETNPLPNRNVALKLCVNVVRKLSAKLKIPLVDVYQVFAECFAEGVDPQKLTLDGAHPTVYGQTLIRDALRSVLRRVR